jgi:predicted dehydrogenase
MTRKVRWGIVGTGRIAQQFVEDFEFVANGKVAAVASRSQKSAALFARQHDIPLALGDYKALFETPSVDAVYIATPHAMHYQNTLDAIAERKHVLCEKPLTVNAEESRRLFHVANASSVFLMEAMWTFFLPAVQRARHWVEQGRIGKIREVRADFGYPQLPFDPESRLYDPALGGGCLLDMGIYPIAIAWLFLRREPVDMQVRARTAPNGVEDEVRMSFSYGEGAGGIRAELATSFRRKLRNQALVIGDRGHVLIPDFWRARECLLYRQEVCIDRFDDGRRSLGYNYETTAVNEDILASRQQNITMPWANTIRFQEQMDRVRETFQAKAG